MPKRAFTAEVGAFKATANEEATHEIISDTDAKVPVMNVEECKH